MELLQMAAYPESWACFPNALSQMNLSGAPWLAWHNWECQQWCCFGEFCHGKVEGLLGSV